MPNLAQLFALLISTSAHIPQVQAVYSKLRGPILDAVTNGVDIADDVLHELSGHATDQHAAVPATTPAA